MSKKVTDEMFRRRAYELVGNEYVFTEKYVKAKVKIGVIHTICGTEYKVSPDNSLRGKRCPECANRKIGMLSRMSHDEFLTRVEEKHPGEYIVLGRYRTGKDRIEVIHKTCGEKYEPRAQDMLTNGACRDCGIKKRAKSRTKDGFEFFAYVLLNSNNEFVPMEPYTKSNEHLKFLHRPCGKEFERSPSHFLKKMMCPYCLEGRSAGEQRVYDVLEREGEEFEVQKSIGGRLRADFYLPEYQAYIEYDGQQHFEPVSIFGGYEGFKKTVYRDTVKNHYFEFLGFPYLRIPYWEESNIEGVAKEFIKELKQKNGDDY